MSALTYAVVVLLISLAALSLVTALAVIGAIKAFHEAMMQIDPADDLRQSPSPPTR